ncbi:MAG: hypothetical protein P8J14_06830, partial [Emcibacteraceae bacterium]|nr:hypothetical protein [Emcibacteraceae bacterium]
AIVNVIDASPHQAGKAYFAIAGFKMNDFTPVLYKTEDYGQSWKKIVKGLPEDTFVRTVREDPMREGLLYAGTETGMFISFDDGENWQEFQLNLPEVPITDLHIRHNDLVVATQGRAFWVLDDLTPLHQINDDLAKQYIFMYQPSNPLRSISLGYPEYSSRDADLLVGKNPPKGLQVNYVLNKDMDEEDIAIEIFDAAGMLVHAEYTNDSRAKCEASPRPMNLKKTKGANRWSWNMMIGRYECFPALLRVTGSLNAYKAAPGTYTVKMTIGDYTENKEFEILVDPRLTGTHAENFKQYQDMDRLNKSLFGIATEMSEGVLELRRAKKQLDVIRDLKPSEQILVKVDALDGAINLWIAKILQEGFRTSQNLYQMEAKFLLEVRTLINRMGSSDVPVSIGAREVAQRYLNEWKALEAELNVLKEKDIKTLM